MPRLLNCPSGHRWETAECLPEEVCPLCGARAKTIKPPRGQDDSNLALSAADSFRDVGKEDPRWFGDYETVEELGRGGMGIVYRARDPTHDREVALKTIRGLDLRTISWLKREFRTVSSIAHENLVSLYELNVHDDLCYFTMELLDGVDFVTYVRCGPSSRRRSPDGKTTFVSPQADVHAGDAIPDARAQRMITTVDYVPEDILHQSPALETTRSKNSGSSVKYGLSDEQLTRLRAALKQLVAGICRIHDAQVLHRDIKRSNVMVVGDGAVKILDFGLALQLEDPEMQGRNRITGTASCMAPEQAACEPLSEATDWYAVGVMLYEALTGLLPFLGAPDEILRRKQCEVPPPPNQVATGVPDDLNDLCIALLNRDPRQRLSPRLVFGLGRSATDEISLVGREEHFAEFEECLDELRNRKPVSVFIRGPSGFGKSALAERFLRRAKQLDGLVVLSGRCYERESVPYKAWDSLIDELASHLTKLPQDDVARWMPDAEALARVFPELHRVEAVARQQGSIQIRSERELRRRAFSALRELLSAMARETPLILCIDDLQWGDVDSATLLAELLRPPDVPPLMFLGCYRSDALQVSPFLRAVEELRAKGPIASDERLIEVGPLRHEEAVRLVLDLLNRHDGEAEHCADIIAREAGGSPYFVTELVKHVQEGGESCADTAAPAPLGLDEMLCARVGECTETERRLLEVIAVAGRPTRPDVAFRVADVTAEGPTLLNKLEAAHFIRRLGTGEEVTIEPYHDRVGESVVGNLEDATRQGHHRNFGNFLEATGNADPQQMAVHFQEAGEHNRAARYYAVAGDATADTLAFDRAAELYRLALDLQTDKGDARRQSLRRKLADSLANAGRGPDAASVYLEASRDAETADRVEMQRLAAMQYLLSGHVNEGRAALRSVLRNVNMRLSESPTRALTGLILKRAQLGVRGLKFRERLPQEIPDSKLIKADICWSVGIGLSVVDPVAGAEYQTRSLLRALAAGEPYRIARALAWEAAHVATAGVSAKRRTARLLDAADEIAQRVQNPHASGMVDLARGVSAHLESSWIEARDSCDRAESIFRTQCRGVAWEIDTAHTFSLWALALIGEFAELGRRRRDWLKQAHERNDLYAMTNLSTYVMALDRLADDDPERALAELEEAKGRWTCDGFHVQHHNVFLAETQIDLYRGRGEAAWERVTQLWPRYKRSLLLRVQQVRIDVLQTRGRIALAAAAQAKAPRRFLASAAADARRLKRERVPWADAAAQLIEAGIAARRGDEDVTNQLIRNAAERFENADMLLFAAASRHYLGLRLGGDEGRALAEPMMKQAARNPAALAYMIAPGFASD